MRHYRVVKLLDHGRSRWVVVSSSIRDDDTWDIIAEFSGRNACFRYIDDLHERNKALEHAGAA